MKRFNCILILFLLAVAALAQAPAKPAIDAPKTEAVKPFTPAQAEQLRTLNGQLTIAQANERAAVAEKDLAQERINSILKDACRDAGIALDDCFIEPTGVRRAPRDKPPTAPKN